MLIHETLSSHRLRLFDNAHWTDWRWQMKNAIRSWESLKRLLALSEQEEKGLLALEEQKGLPLSITPYFLSLMDFENSGDPLRLQVIPRHQEFDAHSIERRDPLGEEDHEVVPHLIHRYPDRVLLLITDRCASYCRFCTRKRWVGQGPTPRAEDLDQALKYIDEHPEIKEVIISGGDALLLSDEHLDRLLSRLRAIKSVEIIRLATRMLSFAPMRITDDLVNIIKQHQPVYFMSHINHPHEIGTLCERALVKLADNGIPVLNQTVLLRHINDNVLVLTELFRHLTRLRARPYYLHQCDIAPGTSSFRVPLDAALALVEKLRGHVSGLSVPQFIIDIPGGFGKVPLAPNPIVARDDRFVSLRGFDGEIAQYPLH